MTPTRNGSFHLFRLAGIDVYLHWSWFVVAVIELGSRRANYSSVTWNVLEYLSLFVIVLLHEFGHSLACRQVGGEANQIVLWPLGGVAYVNPPQRPGATLWSIVAGPLVNVLLVPVFIGLIFVSRMLGLEETMPDLFVFFKTLLFVDVLLLVFNVMPVYPLDGGQILRSLLWFMVGRARSLMITTIIGFFGVALMIAFALYARSVWYGLMAAFMATSCWTGFQHARALSRVAKLPRHVGFACPSCKTAPPIGAYWACGTCRTPFDTFAKNALCPNCATQFDVTRCPDCGAMSPIQSWVSPKS